MKMKRLISGALVAVSLATFMTGCGNKNEVKENKKVENKSGQVDKDKNEASRKVFDEFLKVLKGKNLLEVKEFIVHNIENVSEEIADKMVVEYELLLKTNFSDLIDKFNSQTYFKAINETMDEEYKLNLQAIKDEEIKKEVMNTVDSGYTFQMLEGDYYLTIDYAMINDSFGKYLSENVKPYYEIRKKESEEPTFVEEYVSIDFEEIKNRVVTLEKFIKDNNEFKNKEDLKYMMRWYVQALVSVDYFSNTVDYETGEVNEIVKNTYEELKTSDLKITKEAVEEMDTLLAEYNYVLKSDNEDPSQKVSDLKFKITEEVFTKVEEYYFKN